MDVDWVDVLQAVLLVYGIFLGVSQGSQEFQYSGFLLQMEVSQL